MKLKHKRITIFTALILVILFLGYLPTVLAVSSVYSVYLPIVIKQVPPTLTPTPTATLTSTPTATLTSTATPTATNTPVPDGSRLHPYPIGYVASITENGNQNFTLEVTDVTRGNDAWIKSRYGDIYTVPAPAGQEYVVVKGSVHYISGPDDSILHLGTCNFGIVSNNVIFGLCSFSAFIEPYLQGDLFPGGSVWGYVTKFVYIDDPNPLLYFDDDTVYPDKVYYFSLNQ